MFCITTFYNSFHIEFLKTSYVVWKSGCILNLIEDSNFPKLAAGDVSLIYSSKMLSELCGIYFLMFFLFSILKIYFNRSYIYIYIYIYMYVCMSVEIKGAKQNIE